MLRGKLLGRRKPTHENHGNMAGFWCAGPELRARLTKRRLMAFLHGETRAVAGSSRSRYSEPSLRRPYGCMILRGHLPFARRRIVEPQHQHDAAGNADCEVPA